MSITSGLVAAAIGAGLAASALTLNASADTPAPPPTPWMLKACPVDDHGIPTDSATNCLWVPTSGNVSPAYIVTSRIHREDGYIRQGVDVRCTYYVLPTSAAYSGCWTQKK